MLNDVYKVDKINLHYSKHPIWLLLPAALQCGGKLRRRAALDGSKLSTNSKRRRPRIHEELRECLLVPVATVPELDGPSCLGSSDIYNEINSGPTFIPGTRTCDVSVSRWRLCLRFGCFGEAH